MKIISPGLTRWSDRVACTRCMAQLEIEASDLIKGGREKGGAYPSDRWLETYYYVICPTNGCENQIEVTPTGASEYVLTHARKAGENRDRFTSSLAAQIDAVERGGPGTSQFDK